MSTSKRSMSVSRRCEPDKVNAVRLPPRLGVLLVVLCLVALTGCSRFEDSPRDRRTPLPALTTSSSSGVSKIKRPACGLLTADERTALAGQTMDVIVPVSPVAGTQECQWVHSMGGGEDAVIRMLAFSTHEWAKVALGQIQQAIRNPKFSTDTIKQLQAAAKKLARGSSKLSDEQICDIYWVYVGAWGVKRNGEAVFSATIGRVPAAFASGCADGVFTMLGYGELGLHPSLPLFQAVVAERKKAHERAVDLLVDEKSDGADSEPSDGPSAEPTSSASASSESSDAGPSDGASSDSSE